MIDFKFRRNSYFSPYKDDQRGELLYEECGTTLWLTFQIKEELIQFIHFSEGVEFCWCFYADLFKSIFWGNWDIVLTVSQLQLKET